MRRIPSWGLILGVILVAAIFGGGLGWWVSRTDTAAPAVNSDSTTTEATHQTIIPSPAEMGSATATTAPTDKTKPTPTAPTEQANPSAADSQWQAQLDEVLSTEGEPEQKAERLLRMLPQLNEEAQVEVSQHLVNFITDDGYQPIAAMMTNAATSDAVATVLMTDLLNRNDGLKLPLLLSMARNEAHPKHEDAKELLELYLQENHGTDWNQWESSVTNWLAQNGPDFKLDSAPEPVTETNP